MKTKNTLKKLPDINQSLSECRRIPMALISTIVMLLAVSVQAGNILVNPGFESSPIFASGSWSQHATVTWSMNAATGTAAPLIHTGAEALWMQGVYNSAPQTTYAAEDFACFPGNTYTADAWYSTWVYQTSGVGGFSGNSGLFVADTAGNQDGWVEVLFYNSANALLADYKSLILTPAFEGTASGTNYTGTLATETNASGDIYLAWIDCPVTNQYDPTTVTPNSDPAVTGGITNTLAPGQLITAPAGAVKVEFRISDFQEQFEGGAPFWDDATLNQLGGPSPSAIGNLSPDGSQFFNYSSSSFTFNVTSAASGGAPLPTNPTTGISVVVNGQNETGSLAFGGFPTNVSATLPGLTTNTIYTITVTDTNSVGLVSSRTVTFDTFPTNVFIVSAEDYDYTNGQFFENPTPTAAPAPNSYFGTGGVLGVDVSTYNGTGILDPGSSQLIRSDGYTAMQKAGDIQLPLYAAQNNPNVYNVQIAYNNVGNSLNYTRNYPIGNYFVYLRYNDATPGDYESLNLLTSGYGTSSQTVTNLGEFISVGIGANYAWVPLSDTFGNKIVVNLAAGTNTLQLVSGGMENFVDFIFVPVSGTLPPVINNLYPNNVTAPVNGNIFLNVPNITYTVSSAFSTVSTNNIQTLINGVDVSASASYSGNNTSWSVSVPCPQNELMTLVINAKDATGATNRITETFDTFSQNNLMIEAVDFDFNGGQFIDDPVPTGPIVEATNSYFNGGVNLTNQSVTNVDYSGGATDNGEQWAYRPLDEDAGGQEEQTAANTDFIRSKFTNAVVTAAGGTYAANYDLGWWNAGFWENYTRTIPTNNYVIYSRMAGGAGPFSGTTLSMVTSGRGTTSQTTQLLGSFADANAAGWATWHWVPMRDTNGNLATVSLGGIQTLRLTSGGNANAFYIMLVPAVSLSANLTISISGSNVSLHYPTVVAHNYTVQYNNSLTGGTWQPLSATITGDGTIKAATDTLAPGVPVRFYRLQIQ